MITDTNVASESDEESFATSWGPGGDPGNVPDEVALGPTHSSGSSSTVAAKCNLFGAVPDFAETVVAFLLFDFCANMRGAVVPPVVSGMVLDGRKSAN